jgi:hypothetical protein
MYKEIDRMTHAMIRVTLAAMLLVGLGSCATQKNTSTCCSDTCTAACCQSSGSPLLAEDLSNAILPAGSWTFDQGVLEWVGKGSVWTEASYGDFILDFEFKVVKGTNSGVFIRTGNIKDSVQTGIEIQVLDSYGKAEVGKHDCGAVYDCLAPSQNMAREAGQWNRMTIKAQGPLLSVALNGEEVIDMNLDDWTEARKNPDGSKNKFKTALKDFPRSGQIGFQDHGKQVWYRNIRITPLE